MGISLANLIKEHQNKQKEADKKPNIFEQINIQSNNSESFRSSDSQIKKYSVD